MMSPQVEQSLDGHLAEPQTKGHGPAIQIVWQPTQGFHFRFLHDVRRVESRRDLWIQAKLDHPTHRLTVAREDLREDLSVAGAGRLQQLIGFYRIRCHGVSSPHSFNRDPK